MLVVGFTFGSIITSYSKLDIITYQTHFSCVSCLVCTSSLFSSLHCAFMMIVYVCFSREGQRIESTDATGGSGGGYVQRCQKFSSCTTNLFSLSLSLLLDLSLLYALSVSYFGSLSSHFSTLDSYKSSVMNTVRPLLVPFLLLLRLLLQHQKQKSQKYYNNRYCHKKHAMLISNSNHHHHTSLLSNYCSTISSTFTVVTLFCSGGGRIVNLLSSQSQSTQ